MLANSKSFFMTIAIAAVVITIVLALYKNYSYLIPMGLLLMFLIIIYLGMSIRS